IRSMVPALGNEAVTALKNSSLASVISVEELTLRSTQLASSTFDFFSIFFASGLLYLVLTGSISAIQLIAEAMLDLDRRRTKAADVPNAAATPAPAAAAGVRADVAGRSAVLARRAPGVEVAGLRQRYGAHLVL